MISTTPALYRLVGYVPNWVLRVSDDRAALFGLWLASDESLCGSTWGAVTFGLGTLKQIIFRFAMPETAAGLSVSEIRFRPLRLPCGDEKH